jgi:diguanylate cyclase (GGDEF)-like protein
MSKVDIEIRLEAIGKGVGNENNFLAVLSNITSRKHMEKELHQLAFYDKLTDLPNRRKFIDHLKQSIKSYKRNKKSFALFFMDLDNFKFVNDTLGHEAGDEFLVQVGNRLKEIFRNNDLVARLGGDEFTVLVEDIKFEGREDISFLAEKMLRELASKPIFISGRPLQISTSLGIATYPENGQDGDTLIKHADIAMYSAKKAGKNRHAFFSDRMNELLSKRIEIENDLKAAIELKQVDFYYQPIINLATNQLVGAEALVRWNHPKKGFISPVEFIPIAEASDLIITLSDYLLNIAFKQAHEWQSKIFTPRMSVNISVRQFEKPNFIDCLVYFLEAYQLDAKKIQLEFTESVMLDSTNETILKFEALKKIGFKIAIDDFGTGYSSLGYIHKLPIDVIKIDRSFVSGMLTNKKTNSIVAAVAKLSIALDIKIVAEGIELEAEADMLRQYQCDYGQGYLFDKALPIEEFERKYMKAEKQSLETVLN